MSHVSQVIPSNSPERFTSPKVLLVEPDLDTLVHRAFLLSKSNYTVFTAANYREIFDLRNETDFRLAVLPVSMGDLSLRATAEFIRKQWPSARILLLGVAQSSLEDYLYDELVNLRFQPNKLADALARLGEDFWGLKSFLISVQAGTSGGGTATSRRWIPPESDPRKSAHCKPVEEANDVHTTAKWMRKRRLS